jgi:hypothetical protein
MNAPRACRLGLLVMFVAGAGALSDAQAIEGAGEATAAYELRQHAIAASVLQDDLLDLCESASGAEQFELYSIYNRAMGTWLQVDFLRDLLDVMMAASSRSDEDAIGAALRDQAAFALRELDQSIAYLEVDSAVARSPQSSQRAAVVHSLLWQVRPIVERLAVER